jgi:hypothetical protein
VLRRATISRTASWAREPSPALETLLNASPAMNSAPNCGCPGLDGRLRRSVFLPAAGGAQEASGAACAAIVAVDGRLLHLAVQQTAIDQVRRHRVVIHQQSAAGVARPDGSRKPNS